VLMPLILFPLTLGYVIVLPTISDSRIVRLLSLV
jgi:hypothetical protein